MRSLIFFLLLASAPFARVHAQNGGDASVIFKTEIANPRVTAGQTFEVSFVLKNARAGQFTPPDWAAAKLEVVGGPSQSSSVSIVNGKMSSEYRYRYWVVARDTGAVTLPAASILADGKMLQTAPIELHIGGTPVERPSLQPAETPARPLKSLRPTVRI